MSFNFYSLQPKVQRKPIWLLALLPSPSFPFCYLPCCITVQLLELSHRQWTAKWDFPEAWRSLPGESSTNISPIKHCTKNSVL